MKKKILLVLCVFLFLYACKKNQLGGSSIILGEVSHHFKSISDATVYIKFNATEFPGNDFTLYDDKVISDELGKFNIKCYQGDYYLYAVGIDKNISANTSKMVQGGMPVSIRNNEDLDLELPVSE